MDNVEKIIQAVTDAFSEWLESLCHPYLTCAKIVSDENSPRDRISKSLRIWGISFLLSLILQLPLYRLTGIDWKDAQFHSSNLVIALLVLFLNGSMTHLALRMFKIRSKLEDTLAIYTVIVGCFAPFLAILSYPETLQKLLLLQHVRQENLGLIAAVGRFFNTENTDANSYFDQVTSGAGEIAVISNLLLLTTFTNVISIHYQIDKYRVSSAIVMSAVFVLPLILILTSMNLLVQYVAINPTPFLAPH